MIPTRKAPFAYGECDTDGEQRLLNLRQPLEQPATKITGTPFGLRSCGSEHIHALAHFGLERLGDV